MQEQHADRARLYQQWRELDWPLAVDSLNRLGLTAVPIPVLLDESGVVRAVRPNPGDLDALVATGFPTTQRPTGWTRAQACDTSALADAGDLRGLGDALFEQEHDFDAAIEAYTAALAEAPDDASARFRLGVAYRGRADSEFAVPGDGQSAVDAWSAALDALPNQYIWRRRIQQYGPRLDKPYDFYSWTHEARNALRARGQEPVPLRVEPMGSEVLSPRSEGDAAGPPDPDPEGKIVRDPGRRVWTETVVTPARVPPGGRARVRITFHSATRTWWNHEGDDLQLSVKPGGGGVVTEGLFRAPRGKEAETVGGRTLEFEVRVADDAADGPWNVPAYAVYDVCDDIGGTCVRLRQDLTIDVRVAKDATPLR